MKTNAATHPRYVLPNPHPIIPSDLSAVALAKVEAEGSAQIPPLHNAPVEMTLEESRLAHAKNFAHELNESRLWKIKISYQKRWTPRHLTRKAVEIQLTKPWLRSTGPKTAAGKRRSSLNRFRGDPVDLAMKQALRLHQHFLTTLGLLLRMRKYGYSGEKSFAAHCARLGTAATHALVRALMAGGYDFSAITGKEKSCVTSYPCSYKKPS